jgi:hypothetical protein
MVLQRRVVYLERLESTGHNQDKHDISIFLQNKKPATISDAEMSLGLIARTFSATKGSSVLLNVSRRLIDLLTNPRA